MLRRIFRISMHIHVHVAKLKSNLKMEFNVLFFTLWCMYNDVIALYLHFAHRLHFVSFPKLFLSKWIKRQKYRLCKIDLNKIRLWLRLKLLQEIINFSLYTISLYRFTSRIWTTFLDVYLKAFAFSIHKLQCAPHL